MISAEFAHPYYQDRLEAWKTCRDAYEGAAAIRKRMAARMGGLRFSDFQAVPAIGRQIETAQDLTPRTNELIEGAPYYPAFARTCEGLAGMLLRTPPKIEDATVDWTELLGDVDGNGTPFAQFAEQVVKALLIVGRAVAWLNVRPGTTRVVWRARRAEDLVSWITDDDGALSKAWLKEAKIVPQEKNPDQLDRVDYYRELYIGETGAAISRLVKNPGGEGEGGPMEVLARAGNMGGLGVLPLVVGDIPADETSEDMRPPKPPMLDLAELALSHYQSATDLEHALHWAASPQPYIETSRSISDLVTGPSRMLRIPPGAQVGMLESSGQGLAAQEKALERKSRQMAAIGGRLIDEAVTRHAETATAMKLKSGGDRSLLGSVAGAAETFLAGCLAITALWTGELGQPGRVVLTRDYVDTKLSADEVRGLVELHQTDQITREQLTDALVRGQVIPQPGGNGE